MSLLNKNNPQREKQAQKMQHAEHNIKHAKVPTPNQDQQFSTKPKAKHVVRDYATMRTDRDVICKIKALGMVYEDHNVGITLNRLLENYLPKVLKDSNKKATFKVFYKVFKDRIK